MFVNLDIAVLFRVDDPYKAHYTLENPIKQIQSFVFDQIRSTVPSLDIDDLFKSSQDMALDVLRSIQLFMVSTHGYEIMDVLIVKITPSDEKVIRAMNEIYSCRKIKEAMVYRGEAEKIYAVKSSEAHSEALYLHGVGTSKERQAIAEGLQDTFDSFQDHNDLKAAASVSNKDVMDLLMVTQYYDTLDAISKSHKSGEKDRCDMDTSCTMNNMLF